MECDRPGAVRVTPGQGRPSTPRKRNSGFHVQDRSAEFERHRPRLFGIAYRMLGSRSDAEDVLQDAYLRWHRGASQDLRSPEAWLVTAVTRLCIDRLRVARTQREQYVGPWLPEPLLRQPAFPTTCMSACASTSASKS